MEMNTGEKNQIKYIIQGINLRKLVYPLLTFVVTMVLFLNVPFYEVWNPMTVNHPEEITTLYNEEEYYVDMTWKTLYYSGYDYLENGKTAGSYYYALEEGMCYFVLLSRESAPEQERVLFDVHVKARLDSGNRNLTEVIREMAEDLGWTAQGLAAVTSHVVVNEVDYVLVKYNILFAINTVLALISMITSARLLVFMFIPSRYPACHRLKRYGQKKSHIRQLDKELREENLVYGAMTITRHYLVVISRTDLQIIPLKDIVWAYKHSTFNRYHRQKITYTLRVVGKRSLSLIAVGQKKADADAVLAFLEKNYPKVRIGYTKENEQMARHHEWEKDEKQEA